MSQVKGQQKTLHKNCYRGNIIVQGVFRFAPPCTQLRNAVSLRTANHGQPRHNLLHARLHTKMRYRSICLQGPRIPKHTAHMHGGPRLQSRRQRRHAARTTQPQRKRPTRTEEKHRTKVNGDRLSSWQRQTHAAVRRQAHHKNGVPCNG